MQALTPSAREELDRYFQDARARVISSGADPDEVEEDLRRRLQEELGTRPAGSVGPEELRVLLVRFGPVGWVPVAPLPDRPVRRLVGPAAFTIFGVLLPLTTIGAELVFGWSAEQLFDPLPTWLHVLMCLLVPAGHWLTWRGLEAPSGPTPLAVAANGVATGVSLFYTVLYLPMIPLGVVAIVFFGLGLLPLTPILSLATALVLRRKVRRAAAPARTGWRYAAATAAALLVLVALDLPRTVTRVAAGYAASGGPAERATALGLLRSVGSEGALLRMCYVRAGAGMDLLGSLVAPPVSTRQAREVFFRATGRPFNSVPPPEAGGLRQRVRPQWDEGRGGSAVDDRIEGLSLTSSRIDGSVDAHAAVAYLEWTLELRNDTTVQQEARAQVALPPGAVVSRLTLWIAGEEREAAFASRSQTRAAYESVVRQRRDPVLVTTSGRDRVLVQCFPVPPDGGVMKTRLGITVPLDLATLDRGRLVLPRFDERNFALSEPLTHAVWIDGTAAVSGAGLTPVTRPDGVTLRGALSDAQLLGAEGTLSVAREAARTEAWAVDARVPERPAVVRQTLTLRERAASPMVVVIDGSAGTKAHARAIGRALPAGPADGIAAVLLAGDELRRLRDPAGRGGSWGAQVERSPFVGGQDNLPALAAAWDEADRTGAVIVWIHGPQPVGLSSADALLQRWERRPDGPRLVAFALAPGANRVLEALDGVGAVSVAVRGAASSRTSRGSSIPGCSPRCSRSRPGRASRVRRPVSTRRRRPISWSGCGRATRRGACRRRRPHSPRRRSWRPPIAS